MNQWRPMIVTGYRGTTLEYTLCSTDVSLVRMLLFTGKKLTHGTRRITLTKTENEQLSRNQESLSQSIRFRCVYKTNQCCHLEQMKIVKCSHRSVKLSIRFLSRACVPVPTPFRSFTNNPRRNSASLVLIINLFIFSFRLIIEL